MNGPTSNETLNPRNKFEFEIIGQQVSYVQQVFRLTVVAVGMLLNWFVLLIVSCSRQLRFPRHIFWAVVSLVDCIFLAEIVLELAVIVNHDRLACRFFVLLASADYSVLLLCLSLAAFDRYLAIAHYEWYKRKVTTKNVILLLAGSIFLTFIIITSPFWTGYKSINNCTVNMTLVFWVFTWDLLLGIVCVILQVKIFIESRNVIRQYLPSFHQPPIRLRFINSSAVRLSHQSQGEAVEALQPMGRRMTVLPMEHPAAGNVNIAQVSSTVDQNTDTECFSWLQPRSKVNRLEVRAALSMSMNVLPFWLCTFPVSCNVMAMYWCIRLETDCHTILHISSYLRDFFMFHSIYNPLMYMLTSSEFRRALFHIAWKLKSECGIFANVMRN